MKKIITVVLSLVFALVPTTATFAKDSSERFNVGFDVESSGEYDSSAFFLGTNVDNSSTIKGAYFALGNEIKNAGNYEYGFHAANKIVIQGTYAKDLFAVGNEISITSDAKIAQDAYIACNKLVIESEIPGSAFIAANKIVLKNVTIGGDLRIAASEIEMIGDVKITGVFAYNEDINILGDANVSAGTTAPYKAFSWGLRMGSGARIIGVILNLAASIVLAIIFISFAKKFFNDIKEKAVSADFKYIATTFGIGLLALIVVPLIAGLLMGTIIGLPAGALLLLVYIIALALSITVFSAFIGNKIMPKQGTIFSTTVVLILLALINFIPVFGAIVSSLLMIFGFGIIVSTILERRKA